MEDNKINWKTPVWKSEDSISQNPTLDSQPSPNNNPWESESDDSNPQLYSGDNPPVLDNVWNSSSPEIKVPSVGGDSDIKAKSQKNLINSELDVLLLSLPYIETLEKNIESQLGEQISENMYDFSPSPEDEFGELFKFLVPSFKKMDLKLKNCYIYKIPPKSMQIDLYKDKTYKGFIYKLNTSIQEDINLDFSSMKGPSIPIPFEDNNLVITPGWIPCNITNNQNSNPLFLIIGTLEDVSPIRKQRKF